MAVTPSVLYAGGQLGTSAGTLVTAGFNTTGTVITAATFTNTDTSAHTITVYIVRNGGTASAANAVISGKQISALTDYVAIELQNQILGPGDMIQAKADAGTVVTVAGISGYIVTN